MPSKSRENAVKSHPQRSSRRDLAITCPICFNVFSRSQIAKHADICAAKRESSGQRKKKKSSSSNSSSGSKRGAASEKEKATQKRRRTSTSASRTSASKTSSSQAARASSSTSSSSSSSISVPATQTLDKANGVVVEAKENLNGVKNATPVNAGITRIQNGKVISSSARIPFRGSQQLIDLSNSQLAATLELGGTRTEIKTRGRGPPREVFEAKLPKRLASHVKVIDAFASEASRNMNGTHNATFFGKDDLLNLLRKGNRRKRKKKKLNSLNRTMCSDPFGSKEAVEFVKAEVDRLAALAREKSNKNSLEALLQHTPIAEFAKDEVRKRLQEKLTYDQRDANRIEASDGAIPTQKLARDYVNRIRVCFFSQPLVVTHFFQIIQQFITDQSHGKLLDVMKRVTKLFQIFPAFIIGFNRFLPEGYRMENLQCARDIIAREVAKIGSEFEPPGKKIRPLTKTKVEEFLARVRRRFAKCPAKYARFLEVIILANKTLQQYESGNEVFEKKNWKKTSETNGVARASTGGSVSSDAVNTNNSVSSTLVKTHNSVSSSSSSASSLSTENKNEKDATRKLQENEANRMILYQAEVQKDLSTVWKSVKEIFTPPNEDLLASFESFMPRFRPKAQKSYFTGDYYQHHVQEQTHASSLNYVSLTGESASKAMNRVLGETEEGVAALGIATDDVENTQGQSNYAQKNISLFPENNIRTSMEEGEKTV